MEPFHDDIVSRRLDDLTHQMRLLARSFSSFQLEQHPHRHADRWALAEAPQQVLIGMPHMQQTILAHQRTIGARPTIDMEQQTVINELLIATLTASMSGEQRRNSV